jgi:hypothetical protein
MRAAQVVCAAPCVSQLDECRSVQVAASLFQEPQVAFDVWTTTCAGQVAGGRGLRGRLVLMVSPALDAVHPPPRPTGSTETTRRRLQRLW